MVGEGVEKKLYDAASRGDLATFQQLLPRDPYLLDGVSFAGSRNLLHIATIWGHAAIVEEVLATNPRLARNLDSEKSSPLHMAAAEGHTEIAEKLSSVAPEMCWRRDCQGMNPIHIAAMNGHVEILKELIRLDRFAAMEKVDRGYTVLHLCVKHRCHSALQFLADKLGDLVHSKNDDGETILHLAARYDVEMLRWLVNNTKIDKEAKEWRGRKAVEILEECSSDSSSYSDIIEVLRGGNKLAMETLDKMTEAIMVVAVLIAAMVFQATINPPGGVWQESTNSTHIAGKSVMATTNDRAYKGFVECNTWAFIFSLMTIVLLITRRSIRSPTLFYSILVTVIASIIFVAISYQHSVQAITPNTNKSVAEFSKICVHLSISVFLVFFCGAMYLMIVEPRFSCWQIINITPNRNGDHIQLETV